MFINLNTGKKSIRITFLIIVFFCVSTKSNVLVHAQTTSPLEVILSVEPSTFPSRREVTALVKLKNTGTSPLVLPAMDNVLSGNYFSLEVTHQSGKQIFFLRPILDIKPTHVASSTTRLYPNQQLSFNVVINEDGASFSGFDDPGVTSSLRSYLGNFNVRAKFTVDDGNLPTGGDLTNMFRGTVFSAPAMINVTTPLPSLITEANSTRAIALDSVTFVRDPFPVSTGKNFSSDQRTRIMLIASDIATADFSSVTAQAEDSQQRVFPLSVEYVGKLPNFDWLMQVIVRLPDELANAGDVQVSINVRSTITNKALISIRPPQ